MRHLFLPQFQSVTISIYHSNIYTDLISHTVCSHYYVFWDPWYFLTGSTPVNYKWHETIDYVDYHILTLQQKSRKSSIWLGPPGFDVAILWKDIWVRWFSFCEYSSYMTGHPSCCRKYSIWFHVKYTNTQIWEKQKNPLKLECYPTLFISEKKCHANYIPDEIWCYFARV